MTTQDRHEAEDRAIARLLSYSERSLELPHDRELRIRAGVEQRWRSAVRERPDHRSFSRLLWAAAALAALALLWSRPEGDFPVAATIVRVVQGAGDELEEHEPEQNHVVRVADELETDALTRMALSLASGERLDLDRSTLLRFQSVDTIELTRGAIYVESGEGGSARGVTIHAGGARVRELGTRYEVRRRGDVVAVSVREGRVEVATPSLRGEAGATEQLVLAAGVLRRETIGTVGRSWEWTLDLAERREFDGRALDEFLSWVEAETGWTVRFVPSSLEKPARQALLYGELSGRRPDALLPAAMAACGLDYRLEEGVLTLSHAGSDDVP